MGSSQKVIYSQATLLGMSVRPRLFLPWNLGCIRQWRLERERLPSMLGNSPLQKVNASFPGKWLAFVKESLTEYV